MTNKEVTATYTINQPYQLKSINSEFLNMSCYGYHFTHWKDEDGNTLSDCQQCTFLTPFVSISAQWDKNTYWATFYDDSTKQQVHGSLSAKYKEDCTKGGLTPEPQPTKTGYRLRGWVGGNYKQISTDLDMIADWVAQCYISWVRSSDIEHPICSLTCDEGDSVTYPSLEYFQKPLHTVSSWSPTQEQVSPAKAGSTTVKAVEQENRIIVQKTELPETVSYRDDRYYSISVVNAVQNPNYGTPINIWYRENGGEWQHDPIIYHDLTSVTVDISVDSENFFPYTYSQSLSIVDGQWITVQFKFFDANDSLSVVSKSAREGRDIPRDEIPIPPPMTLTKVFKDWDDIGKTKALHEDQVVSALYEDRYYSVKYYWDETVESKARQYIGEKKALYMGNAYLPRPVLDGYVCQGWGKNYSGRTSDTRSIYGDNLLSSITEDNLSLYAFMRKIHPLKLYNVVDGIATLSTMGKDLSSVIDYEYLDSRNIGISSVQYHEFDRWYPPFDEAISERDGKWRIDHDDYCISAIYKPTQGTLTYHSNFPE